MPLRHTLRSAQWRPCPTRWKYTMTVIIFCKTRHYRAAFRVNSQMANQTQKKPLASLKENISVAKEISRHQVLIIPLLFSSQTLVIAHAGVFVSESWPIPTHPHAPSPFAIGYCCTWWGQAQLTGVAACSTSCLKQVHKGNLNIKKKQ